MIRNLMRRSTFRKASLVLVTMLTTLVSLGIQAQSQHPLFVPVAPEFLSSSFIRCIIKDQRGFMWFGTGNGLIRYDGTNVYRYEHIPGNNRSISDNRINVFLEDNHKNLWIGTGQGLMLYDQNKDNFIDVDSIPGNTNHLSNKYITSLCSDRQGKIWIGTMGNGLNIYDPRTLTFTFLVDQNSRGKIPPSNYVTSLFLVGDSMWVGTKGGLKVFATQTQRLLPLPVGDNSIVSKEITQVILDRKQNIWVATSDREIIKMTAHGNSYALRKIRLEQNRYTEGGGNILTLCVDPLNNLWIGGENSGLSYLDAKSFDITYFEPQEGNSKRLPTNSVRFVYVDNTGITWIGTHSDGPFLIDNNAKQFDFYQRNVFLNKGIIGNNIKDLAEDREGNIWLACDGAGLGKLDLQKNELIYDEVINNKLATRYLSALLFDSEGNLWIGTWGSGVCKLNPKTLELKTYKIQSNGFGDNKVFCMYEDSKKDIWVGTVGSGLFYRDAKTDQFVSLNEETKTNYIKYTNYVTSILEDTDSTIWAGTLFGLFHLTNAKDHTYEYTWYSKNNQPGNIGSNDIHSIQKDTKGNLWFGTDNGVTMLARHGKTFKGIEKKDGLLSNSTGGILFGARGEMWISGNMGISKYSPLTNSFRNYTKDDGLPSNQFNFNARLKATDGKFYFGSDNGLVAFYPDSIEKSTVVPVVYLTDLKLNNQSVQIDAEDSPLRKHIGLTDAIELSYDQRSFAIDFVAINYGQFSKSKYCYMLENFDDNWNCDTESRATYTNIDPGDYVFLVKASNSDGITSASPARLEIRIRQAPWKSWWATLLYIVVVASFLYFLIRIRLERINMRNQLELERVAREKEHDLSESKTQFFTNISHELRTPLSLIAMPLESLMSTVDLPATVRERLDTIRASANKMMRLVNELMDFNKMESSKLKLRVEYGELVQVVSETAGVFKDLAQKKSIHFGIHSMLRSLEGWFDHDKLEKILVNVLSNAFKFSSENGKINMIINSKDVIVGDVQVKSRCLELVIIDNGIGISPEELPFIFDKFYQAKSSSKVANPGTGIGLALTKGLVELHHGTIHAESTPDSETRFVISIPIDKHVYSDDERFENSGALGLPVVLTAAESKGFYKDLMDEDPDKSFILVAEDNDEMRRYIVGEFRQQFNVLEARDGEEGIALALEKSPDLIIGDVMMPEKTGIEMCQVLKNNIKTSHIPFIMLTAKTTVDDQITGIATGADVYITKPFSMRFLVAQVNQIIESRQKLYSRFSQDVYLLPNRVASNEIDQAFLQKAIDYIINNIQDPQLGVDAIAELFNLSRMQIYRKIKALTGKSVVDFIRMVRIKQALKLMDTHKYTLSEIAFQTGFSSSSYFTKCFKDQYGKAPSEYLGSNV